jgi:nitrile hydratase beta subunit
VDGVHDMGGMHGFGRVEPEADEPVFHAPWEGRTVGLMIATVARGLRAGSIRPAIEAIDPATYLASSYYERWARAVEAQVVAGGNLTRGEIEERAAAGGAAPVRSEATDPDLVAAVPAFLDGPQETSGGTAPARFGVGDRVTVARMAPAGHHRCPRYVRGVTGEVARVPGAWPPPGEEGDPETTYTVRFAMRDLWGDDAEPGYVYLDLWERYLS